jgi:3-hydroxyacyl-[acyl-carrier-protein] dehydratase
MRWFWIDKFTQFVSGQQATAVKCVSLAEDHMHDHWVGYPVMPNSLVIEGMAQAGGLLVSEAYRFQELVVLGKVARAKFHSRARPGERLTYQVQVESLGEDGASVSATAHVGDRLHASAQLTFARLNPAQLEGGGRKGVGDQVYSPRLFRQSDLMHWLSLVGVFEVGVRPDGTRLQASDYRQIEEN